MKSDRFHPSTRSDNVSLTGDTASLARRDLLKIVSAAGIGSAVFGRALAATAAAEGPKVTADMIRQAEWISGIKLDDKKRELLVKGLGDAQSDYAKLRAVPIDNSVPPAIRMDVTPGRISSDTSRGAVEPFPVPAPRRPSTDEDLAFAPVTLLSALVRTRQITSRELTELYLDRLRRFDSKLQCVITLTRDLALEQAARADTEIAAGRWRGPLHGIPYGLKDLVAVPGFRTTWGATPYKEQVRKEKATVAQRLEDAGAVLVAKTAVGELAWGDVWYGGTTKNPWKLDQGSSGSSAGSASAAAAGLVGFALGTETWGSIVSPCTRCGATGLRPTFGRVSRYGAMALAWSMDKIGPIARSVEDCALVLDAIHGADGLDPCVADRPFDWPPRRDVRTLRVGVVESLFNEDYTKWADPGENVEGYKQWQVNDKATLELLKSLGVELVPMKLPDDYPIASLAIILGAEAATAFDDLTRTGRDGELVRQVADAWPTTFRQGQMIPAVEYLRANRIRTLVMREMEKIMETIDVYVVPSFGGDNLLMTNLTGHPAVVLPNGFRPLDGTPTSITFQGRLFGETDALALARAYQEATGFHLRRPVVPGV